MVKTLKKILVGRTILVFLVESINKNNYSELVTFSRNKSGEKVMKTIKDFHPYFYVLEEEKVPDDNRILKIEKGFVSINNEKVKKIIVRQSKDVRDLKSNFSKSFESDIIFTNRYIIDVLGEVDIYPLKVLSFDIETDDSNGFPNVKNPEQIITSVSFCDNNEKKKVFTYKSKESNFDLKDDEFRKVVYSEEELLNCVINYFASEDPDVITGWNTSKFDLPYMISRMSKLGLKYSKISPLNYVFLDDEEERVIIKGRVLLDGLEAYEHFRKISNQGRAESYSLEFTSQEILGTGKVEHTDSFHDMWINKTELLSVYNLRDSELVIKILNKLDIVNFFNSIRSKSCSQIEDIFTTTKLVDGLFLREVHNKIILPSKNKSTSEEAFSGGEVYEPKPGLYEYVVVFDVSGMYPSIIKTFNISYETFNKKGEIKLNDDIGFNKGEGLMPKLIKKLGIERSRYKKLMKESVTDEEKKKNNYKQYSIKVLQNSLFGFSGYPGSRLYKKEVAEAITTWGRLLIKHIEDIVESNGYKVVYSDTDSVFFCAKSKNISFVILEAEKLLKTVNDDMKKFSDKYDGEPGFLSMEFEKVFKRILFVGKKGSKNKDSIEGAKKNYAYILAWKDKEFYNDKLGYTGISSKRSDTPRIAKSTQIKVLEMILKNEPKEEIIKIVKDVDSRIRNGEIGVEEIGFPKGISKELDSYGKLKKNSDEIGGVPPVVKGCKYANKYLGKRLGIGSKPKWIYVKKVPEGFPETNVIAFEHDYDLPEGFVPDYDIMIEKILKMKLEEIFRSANFGEIEIFKKLEKEPRLKKEKEITIKSTKSTMNCLNLNDFIVGEKDGTEKFNI